MKTALQQSPSVKQIIYLSALQPDDNSSSHLIARKLTGDLLCQSGIPVTELRASIIVGPGSAAFEIMRDMVYNLPILTPPRWVRSKSSPVALENLLIYLTELLNHPASENRILMSPGRNTLAIKRCSSALLPSVVNGAGWSPFRSLRALSRFISLIW